MTTTYTITANDAFKSLEISFNEKPSEAVRDALKGLRYRWHSVKKVWYGYTTEETVRKAIDDANGEKTVSKPVKAEKKPAEIANKFGVKVGDIFHMSWGYEQTNADFFQVVALCGSSSVRVVKVNPEIISTKPTCSMAEDRTYAITNKLLPASRSIFIKDTENGDIKRVTDYGNGKPCIKISDHHAFKVEPGEFTTYVSWYY